MSKEITGQAAGLEICKALGLDPLLVRSIDLFFRVGDVAFARVEMIVDKEAIEPPITKILKAYRWEAEE